MKTTLLPLTALVVVLLENQIDISWGKLYADPEQETHYLGMVIKADWTSERDVTGKPLIEYRPKGGLAPETRLKLRNTADKAIKGDRDALIKTLGLISHISNIYPSIKPALAAVYKLNCYLQQTPTIQWEEFDREYFIKLVNLSERGSDTLRTGVNGLQVLKQPAARVFTDAADNVVIYHNGTHYTATVEDAWQVFVTEVLSSKSEQNIKQAFIALLPQMNAEGRDQTRMIIP